jgi:GT2 family glycosyltransferase
MRQAEPSAGSRDEAVTQVAGREPAARLASLSVVIPTYNRCAPLLETLEVCRQNAGGVELEFVVIDDGSEDQTAAELEKLAKRMPNLVWRRVENGGPGQARNLGASLAKNEVVLFLGDDIRPVNDEFFRVHAELHGRRESTDLAVLGKVVWPNRKDGEVNYVMAHVQGRPGEQFGYAHFHPFTQLGWRFFYTANVSVKRTLVADWLSEGFSRAFLRAAYEDAEFAYRMMEKREPPMRLLYAPTSVGTHHHPFSTGSFMERQTSAGMMAKVFCELHPSIDVRDSIGLGGIHHALMRPIEPGGEVDTADFLSVIEGLKSWARLIDRRMDLGSQYWHQDLLEAIFSLCYLQGYVMSWTEPGANYAAAYQFLLDEFAKKMTHMIQVELAGPALDQINSITRLATAPPSHGWRARSRLWRWAREKPFLYAIYQELRRIF